MEWAHLLPLSAQISQSWRLTSTKPVTHPRDNPFAPCTRVSDRRRGLAELQPRGFGAYYTAGKPRLPLT
jgi:hypothetical protein